MLLQAAAFIVTSGGITSAGGSVVGAAGGGVVASAGGNVATEVTKHMHTMVICGCK